MLDGPGLGKPPYQTLTNAVRVLQHDPTLGPNRIWYDEFLDRIFFANSPTRMWSDEDEYRLTVYMQETTGMTALADHLVAKAVRLVAKQRPKHVVRDWLLSLVWDDVTRLEHAFEDYWNVDLTVWQPAEYVRAASRNLFIGMVARILRPGCQLDTMVVFEGAQGIQKTSALRVLASEPWYAVAHETVTHKDFLQGFRGKWLIEIGELDAFNRAEVTRVKTVISTPTDTYRPSYGRTPMDYPRQCIFAGTTNKDDWGNDETGLRRFWPIRCGPIDVTLLAAAREQLFAEAVQAFQRSATWWEMPAVSTLAAQADRQAEHAWTPLVLTGLLGQVETSIAYVLISILKFQPHQITVQAQKEVAGILRKAGWHKQNLRRNGQQGKTWTLIGNGIGSTP